MQVVEDLSYVILLRKKFSCLESIPGVLLPHPSSSAFPFKIDYPNTPPGMPVSMENFNNWDYHHHHPPPPHSMDVYNQQCHLMNQQPMRITPSMSSLEALLSKLPSVGIGIGSPTVGVSPPPAVLPSSAGLFYDACTQSNLGMVAAKEELGQERIHVVDDCDQDEIGNGSGETSNSIPPPQVFNTSNNYIDLISKPNGGF